MYKIPLIIKREYLTRVRKKSFIMMTILVPLLIVGLLFISLRLSGINDVKVKNIAVIDHSGKYESVLQSTGSYHFYSMNQPLSSLEDGNDFYALLIIPDDLTQNAPEITLYSDYEISPELKKYISEAFSSYVENEKLSRRIPHLNEIRKETQTDVSVKSLKWSAEDVEDKPMQETSLVIGLAAAFLIYFFIFTYGTMVMRAVTEEKSNRVIEVIISSVRPIELMFGKIIGIALVGLTQFLIWIGIIFVLSVLLTNVFSPEAMLLQNVNAGVMGENASLSALFHTGFTKIVVFFFVYFLGGYLLYASLFAAVGAASDHDTDTQQFIFPVTLPIILALFAAVYSLSNPDGQVAFWASVIPLTSPVVMMIRISVGVPVWQIALSVSLLIASFIFTTWVAAKIYRTGILMYGKNVSYKEIWRWVRNRVDAS